MDVESSSSWFSRWLENSIDVDENEVKGNDAAVLRNTVVVYGSVLLITWVVFCWVRQAYPRPFTVRSWVDKEELQTDLAKDQYGFLSWMWMLFTITDDELLQEAGMDALCFLRTLRMGYRLCMLGIFNSLWLFPMYATAKEAGDTADVTDPVQRLTIAHVPAGSSRLVGTTLAAYMLFVTCMYLILQELQWFTEMRHKYLQMDVPRNYSVYVRNIPEAFRTNAGLTQFFRNCFGNDAVAEARIRVKDGNLEKLVQKRSQFIFQLETAVAKQDLTPDTPIRIKRPTDAGLVGNVGNLVGNVTSVVPGVKGGGQSDMVDPIQYYTEELKDINIQITEAIRGLEQDMQKRGDENVRVMSTNPTMEEAIEEPRAETNQGVIVSDDTNIINDQHEDLSQSLATPPPKGLMKGFQQSTKGLKNVAGAGLGAATNIAGSAMNILGNADEDGTPYSAGFVSFNSLSTTHAARQMIHHQDAYKFEVVAAPDPDDVFWSNVGLSHKELEFGNLISIAASVAICLLWTIPTSFVSSLSSIDGLEDKFDWIAKANEKVPVLRPIIEQLAPFLIVVFNGLLPVILERLSMFEGPVSGTVVGASTFTKLSYFMIIQTFFVTAISGSLLDELEALANDLGGIVPLLANSIPGQSTFFTQIAFVGTVMLILFENLRIVALIMAFLRTFVGPKLTEKMRQTTFFGIRPLADPAEFEHASNMAQITVLYFMIMLVTAPLTSYFMGACFGILQPALLHQFVYIYPKTPDSGGDIWANFIKILLNIMVVAQIVLVGLMGIKEGVIAAPLMFPLIIITILFNIYVQKEHFRVAQNLPSFECLEKDMRADGGVCDLSHLNGAYTQEALREKEAFPEDIDEDRLTKLGLFPKDPEDPSESTINLKVYADSVETEADNASMFGRFFGKK